MDASPAAHPSDQVLRAYGLGKLDQTIAESVERHLESCPACRRRVGALSSDSFLDRLRDVQGSPAMSTTGRLPSGPSQAERGQTCTAEPAAGWLPPELAEHPDYQVIRELGQGGMGLVYLAHNRLMDRHEVLKVVSSQLMNRRGVQDRFLTEIRNAAKLHHPNIVTAYSAMRAGASLLFAMEYVDGYDLARLVQLGGPLSVEHACHFAYQAALGLQYAHEQGMVHRDIKPSNLIVARQGKRAVVKVLDFGLAKATREGSLQGGLTHEGQMLGTPDFIAPEQIDDARKADIRADIYSLGCTLYYLLTGGPPFQGTNLYDILQAHHSMEALPLNLARPEVPVELAALVGKMMAKEPGRRFQQPQDVAQALVPFFKPGQARARGAKAELSQAEGSVAGQEPAGTAPAATGPATPLATATRPPVGEPAGSTQRGSMSHGQVGLGAIESSTQSPPDGVPANRRRRWGSPLLDVAASLLGVAVLILVVFRNTDQGPKHAPGQPPATIRAAAARGDTPGPVVDRDRSPDGTSHPDSANPREARREAVEGERGGEGASSKDARGGAPQRIPAKPAPSVVAVKPAPAPPVRHGPPAAKDTTEQRLAKLGLKKLADGRYILEQESDVKQRFDKAEPLFRGNSRYADLVKKKWEIESIEAKIAELKRLDAQLNGPIFEHEQALRLIPNPRNNVEQAQRDEIRFGLEQLLTLRNAYKNEAESLNSQLPTPRERQEFDHELQPFRQALRGLREAITSVDRKYEEIAKNHEVRSAGVMSGPSADYRQMVAKVEKEIADLVGPDAVP
jgi:hypothetical protein